MKLNIKLLAFFAALAAACACGVICLHSAADAANIVSDVMGAQ